MYDWEGTEDTWEEGGRGMFIVHAPVRATDPFLSGLGCSWVCFGAQDDQA